MINYRVNRIWIVHYPGNDLNGGKITYMGYGDHFHTTEVCEYLLFLSDHI